MTSWTALRFYCIVAASGAILMALEILASRVLAPSFGNSVYVWGSIISVFLGALSAGYYWGGRLADRRPSISYVGRLLALAGLCQAILLLAGNRLSAALGAWTHSSPAGTLLAASILFGPATVLFATVSPFAIRLATRDLAHVGNVAGRLYALSTAGSLLGTLACTFLLIPFLRLKEILGLLLALTVVTAALALVETWRREIPAALLAALLLSLAISEGRSADRLESSVIYRRITPYQSLEVRETEGVRILLSDGFEQTGVRMADGEPALKYPRYAPAVLLVQPEIKRMLILGLGGGTTGRYFRRRIPEVEIDYVEIDPAVPEVARRFLGYEDHEGVEIHLGDGRNFLRESTAQWDFIFSDTYIGLAVPFHLATTEFFDLVEDRLSPNGVFAVNLAAGLDHPFTRAMYATLDSTFKASYVFSVPRSSNIIIVATNQTPRLRQHQLVEHARTLDQRWGFEPSLAAIAASQLAVDLEVSSLEPLRDHFAPVDRLIHLARDDWQPRSPREP